MDKRFKNKAIDVMTKLLEFARSLPVFSVDFNVLASNTNIEEYIINHVDRIDWNGKTLPDEEIKQNIIRALERFRTSNGFNASGKSVLTLRKCFSLQHINYRTIYELVSGESIDIPKGYVFVGNIKLSE